MIILVRNLLLVPHARRNTLTTRIAFLALVLASFVVAATARAQSTEASADDTARLLAGLPVAAGSPLTPLAQDPIARQHAANLDTAFGNVEKNQLSKIRAWASTNLKEPSPNMFYLFGGPDFLYANAFFPNATTYVLTGLEPVGQIPDLMKLPRPTTLQALRNIQGSLRSILSVSYFITVQMEHDLNANPLNGTLPVLYVFLARSGKTIHDVSLVHLDPQGALHDGDGARPPAPARGAKITFSEKDGPKKTLYYFSTNLADSSAKNIALLQFGRSLGKGDSFIKSASYLLHNPNFSQARNFLLDNSNTLLQDDTGVPLNYFDQAKWELRGFGRYVIPYQRTQPTPIDFGIGYQWRPNTSRILLAMRNPPGAETSPVQQPVTQQPAVQQQPRPPVVQQPAAPPQATGPVPPRQVYRPPARTEAEQRQVPPPIPIFPFFLFMQPPPGASNP